MVTVSPRSTPLLVAMGSGALGPGSHRSQLHQGAPLLFEARLRGGVPGSLWPQFRSVLVQAERRFWVVS